jgi:hypothetical protein
MNSHRCRRAKVVGPKRFGRRKRTSFFGKENPSELNKGKIRRNRDPKLLSIQSPRVVKRKD